MSFFGNIQKMNFDHDCRVSVPTSLTSVAAFTDSSANDEGDATRAVIGGDHDVISDVAPTLISPSSPTTTHSPLGATIVHLTIL